MFRSGFQLSTDAHFIAAMHNNKPVQAWQDGQALHHGGPIEAYTDKSVKIAGQYFLRESCTFIVR